MKLGFNYFKGRVKGDFETKGHQYVHIGEAEADYLFHNVHIDQVEIIPINNKAVLQNEESFDADTIYGCKLSYSGKTYEDVTITNCIIKEFYPKEQVRDNENAAGSFNGVIYGKIESLDSLSMTAERQISSDTDSSNRKSNFVSGLSGCIGLLIKSLMLLGLIGLLLLLFDKGCAPNMSSSLPCYGVDTFYIHDTIYVDPKSGNQVIGFGTTPKNCSGYLNAGGTTSDDPLSILADTMTVNDENNRNTISLNTTDLTDVLMTLSDYWENDGDVVSIFLNDSPIAEYVSIDGNKIELTTNFQNGKNKIEIVAHSIGHGTLKIATPILELNSSKIHKVIKSEVSLNESVVFYIKNVN